MARPVGETDERQYFRGFLTIDGTPKEGRYVMSDPGKRVTPATTTIVRRLKRIADREGMSLTSLSLAWVASQPGITSPIIGARSIEQLDESVAACQIVLEPRVLAAIDKVVAPGSNILDYYSANFGPNARPR